MTSAKAERLDHFMARANAIYYASHDPFADFTTAPEISQVFGEIIGLWAAVAWQALGRPSPIALVEAGPGRGTMMADARRAIQRAVPAFAAALRIHLIETSPRLKAAQAARLPNATWHATQLTIPDGPLILLANEFLDAMPIRQFVRRGSGWVERHVTGGAWRELPAGPPNIAAAEVAGEGDIVELNETSRTFVADIAARVLRHKGAALFLDYGPARSGVGDSLQALENKRPVDPLVTPGRADLTAHVDFADLAAVGRAAGARVAGPIPQGAFLTSLGLLQRIDRLAQGQAPEQAAALRQAAYRLADPAAMGQLFKVMAVASPSCGALPGF